MLLLCFYFAAAIDSGGLFVMHDGAQKCLCQEDTGSYFEIGSLLNKLTDDNLFQISKCLVLCILFST